MVLFHNKWLWFCAAGLAFLMQPSPARASPLLVLDSSLSASLMMLVNPNLCITYGYDLNGNRVLRTDGTYGSPGVTWGSAVYACFDWTSS